jgi:flagellar protein FliS
VTYDPTAAYRSAQVTTSSPLAQVVLLYQGAIRFATLSAQQLERRDLEASHNASIRAQAIVSALRETLDLSAGDLALRLDAAYDFILARLVAGNVIKDPRPTREAIGLLRELLEAWRTIAAPAPAAAAPAPAAAAPQPRPAAGLSMSMYGARFETARA